MRSSIKVLMALRLLGNPQYEYSCTMVSLISLIVSPASSAVFSSCFSCFKFPTVVKDDTPTIACWRALSLLPGDFARGDQVITEF